MMDSRIFRGSFEHNFCSCGRQRNGSFQKFACAELNLVWFLLIVIYLNREELDCKRGGWSWETSLSDHIAAARIILGWINSIEEFLFHCLKSWPRVGAGGSIVYRKETTRLQFDLLWLETASCQEMQFLNWW